MPIKLQHASRKAVQEVTEIKREVKEKLVTLAAAAFTLVAALAWNDAVQTIFQVLFPKTDGVIGKLIYALMVTVVVVVLALYLKKLGEKKEGQ